MTPIILLTTPDLDARAFNAGYEARYVQRLPRSANPYPIPLLRDREWWDVGWSYRGWMPGPELPKSQSFVLR